MKRIGILTGGGDVPGLNSVIKSVVYRSSEVGWQTMGIRRGWQGLTHVDPSREDGGGYLRPLDRVSTRVIDRTGGTVLHTSRTSPSSMGRTALPEHLEPARVASLEVEGGRYDLTPLVLENLERLALDALVVIGGDDTLSYAARLGREGYPVVAIPKTMDNDVQGTEYCIGFSTAVTRAKELINRQRTTLGSHERIGVFRIFGRNSGYSAWYAAYVTSTRCVIPEVRFDLDALASLLADDRRLNPSAYSFVIASEGAIWQGGELREVGEADAYGHRHKADVGEALADELHRRTGVETVHPTSPTTCAAAIPMPSTRWWRPPSPTWRSTCCRRASSAGWSPSATASTRTRHCPSDRSVRGRSTSRRCTTPPGSDRATRQSSARRCCWGRRSSGERRAGTLRPRASPADDRAPRTRHRGRVRGHGGADGAPRHGQ